jgi:DNA modification methylase
MPSKLSSPTEEPAEKQPATRKNWRNRIVEYGVTDAAELVTNPANFRVHPIPQVQALTGSLNDLGWIAPVIVNRLTGRVVDGHLRARLAGEQASLLPVAYVELSEKEEREALLALDPIAAMATIDRERLGELLAKVESEEQGIKQLLERLARENDLYHPRGEDPGPDLDHAEGLQEKWRVEPGHLYQVGRHRLMCGDVTDADAVGRLLSGSLGHICVTDPPWNVAYGKAANPRWRTRSIKNDDLGADFPAFAKAFCQVIADSLLPGGLLYLVMSAQEWPVIDRCLREVGLHWSSTIIWAKDRPVLSRKDYHTQYEPLWYGWKEGASRLAPVEDRSQSDLWQIPRPARSDEHPTMKPVELFMRALLNSSRPDDLVFDPFLGSGTTAVAAEQTGRTCRALDIEPKYIAVTLERLSIMGLTPRLLERGE